MQINTLLTHTLPLVPKFNQYLYAVRAFDTFVYVFILYSEQNMHPTHSTDNIC